MYVILGLNISLIIAWILHKILNRNFFPVWLCVFVTILTVVVSFMTIITITDFGVTNESMLYLTSAVLCWISSVTVWKN